MWNLWGASQPGTAWARPGTPCKGEEQQEIPNLAPPGRRGGPGGPPWALVGVRPGERHGGAL